MSILKAISMSVQPMVKMLLSAMPGTDNQLLKERGSANYSVYLEILSSAMSQSNIIERENIWKEKLGSRAHGLNVN